MARLSSATIGSLPRSVRLPQYDRDRLAVGMAHIGVGAFHRCHQSEFTDEMLEKSFGPWGEVGINLRPPHLGSMLGNQDGLYSRTLREGSSAETRIIGALKRVIDVADPAGLEAAVMALADPAVKVVTMTVTEKAYHRVPSTGKLDRENPDLAHDMAGDGEPRTVLGLLALALARRKNVQAGPLTVISCDNVPSNGELLASVLAEFVGSAAPDLAGWIEKKVAFPSTMVDRIVPATGPGDIDHAQTVLGVRDEAPVVGEAFRQWVIEDRFAGDRPPWDLAGVQFVRDVMPYELIKMRVLNAAQSTLSHLGAIVGHTFSHEAASDPVLATLVRRMLERETASTLPVLPDMPVAPYIETSMRRIANRAIQHRCHQIGTDGSQKIVQRLVNPLREQLGAGGPATMLALAVASWMAYCLCGAPRFGKRWTPDDPFAGKVAEIAERAGDFPAISRQLLSIEAIFGTDLVASPVADEMGRHLEGLLGGDPQTYLAALARNG